MQKLLYHLESNQLNINDFDNRNDFTNHIIKNMTNDNLIGQGAVGKVYAFENYVVKQITPCTYKEGPLQRYCVDITKLEDKINSIPGGNNKHRYILPNLLSEIAIGSIIKDIGFTNTITSMILKENNELSIYIVMEALEPFIINHYINPKIEFGKKELLFLLFQVSHTLLTVQTKYKFTHYDLHTENLLWEPMMTTSYPLPNQNMKVMITKKNCSFRIKISDFALARLESKTFIISPSVDDFPIKSYGEFNPNYDFACLLGCIFIDSKYKVAFNNYDLDSFVSWYFNENKTLEEIKHTYYKQIGKKFSFRPKQNEFFIPYMNTKSMVDVVNYLAKELIINKYVVPHHNPDLTIKDLGYYKSYNPIILWQPKLKAKKPTSITYDVKNMTIDQDIIVSKYYVRINEEFKEYNLTIDQIQIETCPIQEQYFTVIKIDKSTNYQFNYDCCKIDGPNYLMQQDKVGFVINGTFYSCKKDFLPIGPYKDQYHYINQYKIPEQYKDDYRYVILKNNQLSINKSSHNHYFASGPLLIENGKIIYKTLKQYECHDAKYAKELMVEQNEEDITVIGRYDCDGKLIPNLKTYKRCDRIEPGELTHGNNPNPRSVLCITPTHYLFIAFEGRLHQGYGVDFLQMSKLILHFFPDVTEAINMDGGKSSSLSWKNNYDNIIYTSNPDRFYYYPCGNIISLFKND